MRHFSHSAEMPSGISVMLGVVVVASRFSYRCPIVKRMACRSDFGSGASFNHLRTIHGGLRYLQSLDLRRARESVHERRTVARR